jgi:hypothetical protein
MQISLSRTSAFDPAIIETALHHNGSGEQHKGSMSKLQHICTMNSSTEVLKLPGKYMVRNQNGHRYRRATVTLALLTVTSSIIEGSHDAWLGYRSLSL